LNEASHTADSRHIYQCLGQQFGINLAIQIASDPSVILLRSFKAKLYSRQTHQLQLLQSIRFSPGNGRAITVLG